MTSMHKTKIFFGRFIVVTSGIIILIIVAVTFTSISSQAQSPATSFDFPLGDGTYNYGPILQYYGNPSVIVEDTRYGIKNPDLGSRITCFGQPWNNVYHAGEDWYRFDKNTGQLLDTAGAIVKAVGNGRVVHVSDNIYPGYAIIIEHSLSPPKDGHNKIYSVYIHLDNGVLVSVGDVVNKGTPLGTVLFQPWSGTNPDPSRPSYDSHLHWEMRYFLDGSNIYDPATSCNDPGRTIAGRGYTYPQHPDNFPANTPYVNPSEFVMNYSGEVRVYLPIIYKNHAPTPTPLPTPSSTPPPVPCVEGQDLIINGSLEQNIGSWPQWVQDDGDPNDNWPLIDTQQPFDGLYGIWMGGRNNADEEIYQVVTLPNNISWAEVKFHFYVTTAETTPIDWDYLYWDLKDDRNGNSVLQNPVKFTNQYAYKDRWVIQPIHFTQLQNLIPDRRQVRLSISDTTDSSNITSFFIDNVKFITHCN